MPDNRMFDEYAEQRGCLKAVGALNLREFPDKFPLVLSKRNLEQLILQNGC
jgi:hypothetical protein